MTFGDNVEKKAELLRKAIFHHPFTTGIGDGTVDVEKFKFYVRQDYLYLIDYSRVLALASARSEGLETMGWFARLLHETLNTEMELHLSYCAQFSISQRELEETQASPTTLAYTRYLLTIAYHHTFPALVAALLPCQWGYWEIGNYLNQRGLPRHTPLYCQWIEMYASEEFKALADWLRDLANTLAQSQDRQGIQEMEKAYLTSLRYEYLFWESCYNLEVWPI